MDQLSKLDDELKKNIINHSAHPNDDHFCGCSSRFYNTKKRFEENEITDECIKSINLVCSKLKNCFPADDEMYKNCRNSVKFLLCNGFDLLEFENDGLIVVRTCMIINEHAKLEKAFKILNEINEISWG